MPAFAPEFQIPLESIDSACLPELRFQLDVVGAYRGQILYESDNAYAQQHFFNTIRSANAMILENWSWRNEMDTAERDAMVVLLEDSEQILRGVGNVVLADQLKGYAEEMASLTMEKFRDKYRMQSA